MKQQPGTEVLRPKVRKRYGAAVPHYKNTENRKSTVMPPPETVTLLMQQHIGPACKTTVKPGDAVKVGEVVGDSDAYITAPIHASVSGTVKAIKQVMLPSGQMSEAVVIESDGKMEPFEGLRPPQAASREELAKAARDCGLVGLGGAGFPMHVKLTPPEGAKIDTLIINAAECEPFITSDHREILENADNIMYGVFRLLTLLNVPRVIIAVEDNKPDAIELLCKIANDSRDIDNRVRVMELKSRYPQGAEKVLIQSVTGREVPPGKLPSDVGCIVMNVTSVGKLADYLQTGMPLVSKRLTVDGSAVGNPQNVIVPLGTAVKDVIEFCGGYRRKPKKLPMGGPMMGLALTDDEMPVLKQNNAILAFAKPDALLPEEEPCIRCGRCVRACPMSLMPTVLERYARAGDAEGLKAYGITSCMECGSCAYVCPAHRNLVQQMRLGKAQLRKAGK